MKTMKRTLFYIVCIMAGILQSCTNEVDDLFDKSAQERMNEELQTCKSLLLSAEYGWLLEYYPSSKQSYGGYVMTVKFDEQQVTAASEITNDPSKTVSSYYSLKSDMGPTLNFDTYNEILHYFADPDKSEGAGLGKGYEGDYEFIIMSHTDNEIVLKGKKTKNTMHMFKLKEPSEEYLTKVMNMTQSITSVLGIDSYNGVLNGLSMNFSFSENRKIEIEVGTEESHTLAYTYTDNGIRLYESVEIGGLEVNELEWSDEQQTFIAANQVLSPILDPNYERYIAFYGNYTMKYNNGSKDVEVPITLSLGTYNASQKNYTVEGLSFPLPLYYNPTKDCLEILTLNAGEYYVAVWEVTGKGNLTWGTGPGLLGIERNDEETMEQYYSFEDNGVWKTYIARAIILWSAEGEYKGFGGDTRYIDIKLYKNDQ